jgi:integral membrane sensor domain MASE1
MNPAPGLTSVRRPTWLVIAVVVTIYTAGALIAFVAWGATAVVVLFLPAGVTVSALLLTERSQWPWILVAVGLTEVAVDVSQGLALSSVWGFALANTVEPLVGALLFRRMVPGDIDLLRRRDLLAFIRCCVVTGPMVGAVFGAYAISAGTDRSWLESFLPFWTGDATGVLTVGGCILTWHYRPRGGLPTNLRWGLVLLATALVTALGFWPSHLHLFYLPIPLLFWLAFTQPLPVTLSCGLVITATANWMTSLGRGPWATLDSPGPVKTATMQLFLVIAVLGAWFLAVGVAERDSARSTTTVERAARQRLHAIQRLTALLSEASTSQAIAQAVVDNGVGFIAHHGIAGIVSSDGTEVRTWTGGQRPAHLTQRHGHLPITARSSLTDAIRTNGRVVCQSLEAMRANYPELAEAYRRLGLHSGLSVPIRGGDGRPLGAVAFGFVHDNAIDKDVIGFAETLTGLAGQALQRAQAYEREHDAAHQLQQALLPVLGTDVPGIEVGATYRPADRSHDVGGDWYDVFALPDGRIGMAVGDVVGHDLPGAAAMARLQMTLRILARSADGPAQLLDDLDEASVLVADADVTTVGYADYDPRTRLLRYSCAGHPPPLLLTHGRAEILWGARSMPVGISKRPPREHAERRVEVGSTFIWYTDGLVERRGLSLDSGFERLAAAAATLHATDPADLCRRLLQEMSHGESMQDDTVVLCVRFTASRA